MTTLHRLADFPMSERERDLAGHAAKRRHMLVVPALYSEVDEPAFARIIGNLRDHPFADPVVVSMNRMDAAQFARARAFLSGLSGTHRVLWNDGPRVKAFREQVEASGSGKIPEGKGTNVWMALGYAIARGDIASVAAHDADIVSYGRELLARLSTPVLDPAMHYAFAKGYYARVSDRMYGRVTRLLVLPLIRAMRKTLGPLPLLDFLEGFRYPLAGEFAMDLGLAGRLRLPGHWGLETGMLCEVFRRGTPDSVCQVGLGSGFEHRHRELETDPAAARQQDALAGMAQDIVETLFLALATDGTVWSSPLFTELGNSYRAEGSAAVGRYHDDARLNGLRFDADGERATVARFGTVLELAAGDFLGQAPLDASLPSWDALFADHPQLRPCLVDAVEADNS